MLKLPVRYILDFSEARNIIVNNQILAYNKDMLQEIASQSSLWVVVNPGSYTGIRRSLAIAHGIAMINPKINLYGLNLIKDIGAKITLKPILFKEKFVNYYFDRTNIVLSQDHKGDFDIHSFETYKPYLINTDFPLTKNLLQLKYYDKFA